MAGSAVLVWAEGGLGLVGLSLTFALVSIAYSCVVIARSGRLIAELDQWVTICLAQDRALEMSSAGPIRAPFWSCGPCRVGRHRDCVRGIPGGCRCAAHEHWGVAGSPRREGQR